MKNQSRYHSSYSQVERNKGPSLEKAYLYTVDKQQVSFIDIDGSTQETGQENTAVRPRKDLFEKLKNATSVCTLMRMNQCCVSAETSELKPESTFDRGQNSSHTRALSDGHSIDTSSSSKIFEIQTRE